LLNTAVKVMQQPDYKAQHHNVLRPRSQILD
jgi:hypothetical protein